MVAPFFDRYESSELISAEYGRRILDFRIIARRWNGFAIGKNIFYAEIVGNQSIDIHECYPNSESIQSIPFSTSRIDQGWTFHGGRVYRMGGYYSAEGGRTSDEVIISHSQNQTPFYSDFIHADKG